MAEVLINSQYFKHNLNLISKHLFNRQTLALVLKDNAYGHGLREIASLARENGIESVFVKNEFEALQIKNDFKHITAFYGSISHDSPNNIYQSVQTLTTLKNLSTNRGFELEINCGMNRNGIHPTQLKDAFAIIAKRNLKLIGVFSHNGFSDEGGECMKMQEDTSLEVQRQVLDLCSFYSLPTPRFHFHNSSGTFRKKNIQELVRIGIAGYGYLCANHPLCAELKPIASLWADKICSHQLKKGERIGYGGVWQMPNDGVVSSYDLGYGDGLFRISEYTKKKLYCAEGEQILPRMSMDCFSTISQKERICLFRDVREWAEIFETIPYEILTKLSPFIKRRIV
ncbi:alanine racemase [Helicobacter cholecystus]|uniref:Alanine racemase n=1 Tax=Helicobacter cholecystus TaxID=45498 RepID=A0A3D8IYQ3_9HELI|nr:alanine racemase [Helicobacter cholecystus]RDU69691.1 alanine racemase [Helicobacter cholecystus]VEJ24257.1 alanine racemase [Helicobacter cholecystus]